MALFRAASLSSITVSENGRTLNLTFENSKGSKTDLEVETVLLRPMLQQISGALSEAESKSSLSNQGVIAAMSPSQTTAGRTEDGEAVLVSFRLPNSLQYSFALASKDALHLGQQIVGEAQKNIGSSPLTSH